VLQLLYGNEVNGVARLLGGTEEGGTFEIAGDAEKSHG
jgi:hypothetical protein